MVRMWKYRKGLSQLVGILGTILTLVVFYKEPSFPTPDKLLVFLTLVFMAFGQGWRLFKRLTPFVVLLLVYESFRGLVPQLNTHVNYWAMVVVDRFMFGGTLPTTILQRWLWHGHIQWYDFLFYLAYMLHFVLPVALALVIWKTRISHYWHYITAYVGVSFAGFLTFLAFPAAPPWLASDKGIIEPIVRISSHVFYAFGIKDFPSVYNRLSPNPVAAVPSLHAAFSTLFALYITVLFKPEKRQKKWSWATLRWLAWSHPLLIWVGTVYQGEHYAIDEILGILYAIAAYYAAPHILQGVLWCSKKVHNRLHPSLQRVLK